MKTLIVSLACLLLIGCGNGEVINTRSLGKILDADVISTSWNESVKMKVKTEKTVVILYAITSVELGREAFFITKQFPMSKRKYFAWDASPETGNTNTYYMIPMR